MLAKLLYKKEVLVIGKEEPDPNWEGINGLRYIQTSEFNMKYVPPAHLPEQNSINLLHISMKPIPNMAKPIPINTVAEKVPTFKKVEIKPEKIEKNEFLPKLKSAIQESKPVPVTVIPPTQPIETTPNKTEKDSEPTLPSPKKFEEEPTKEIMENHVAQEDIKPEKSIDKNSYVTSDDLDSIKSDNDFTNASTTKIQNDFDEFFEECSFSKQDKPVERSVRYSQSAHLANALY